MNIRMDEDTRRQLKDFSNQIGIPAASIVSASIKQILRSGAITFSTELTPTPYLEKLIQEAEADYKAGKNITVTSTDQETLAFLRSL